MEKSDLIELDVSSDSNLSTEEKETSITLPNDSGICTLYSDVPTIIKWVLSIEESDVVDYRLKDGDLVGIKANVPKGVLKLQSNARKSNAHSHMVSYGPLR